MAKRGYKLQEFVAHSSAVKCLSIGKKTSRLLVTGGEDYKVNLWAIGKPTSLLSLSGHTSSVESLTFDSSEVLVVSGASTGVIKLWDLEEGKIVRTLTGHKSQCNTLEFHPFGEFFASGSSDTNLKIWDVRKKGCIHTYKGHTRGVSTIRFTPDGRWVVSGGADSVVKVWDLTAGKLLHEFKFHDRPIRCLDFHPLEFLLATGSADKTVNFWDLETFELIGSAGSEATGVRSMTFHPDGKTLFCGLEDSLKVYSWEPIICHDSVDMGWPTLGGLSIHEGKLLACSYYRNCVGVWVADISLIGPYDAGSSLLSHVNMERTLDIQESHSAERLRGLINSNSRLLTTAEDIESLEIRNIYVDTSASKKVTPKRLGSISATKVVLPLDSSEAINPSASKKIPEPTTHTRSSTQVVSRPAVTQVVSRPAVTQVVSRPAVTVPVVVPRNNPNAGNPANSRRESMTPEGASPGMLLKSTHKRRAPNSKSETDLVRAESRCLNSNTSDFDSLPEPKFRFSFFPAKDEASETRDDNNKNMTVTRNPENNLSPDVPLSSSNENCDESQSYSREISSSRPVNGGVQFGRTRSLVERFERREICNSKSEDLSISASIDGKRESHTLLHVSKGQPQKFGLESVKFDNEPKGRPQSSGGVKFDNEPKGRPQSSGGVQFDNEPKGRPQSSGGESVKFDDAWKRQAQTSGYRSVKFDNEQKGRPQTSGGESVRCDNERKRQPQISGGYSVRFDNERKRQPQTSRGDSVKFDDEQTRRPHTYGEESVKFNIELEDQPHTSGGEPTSQSDEDVMSYLMQNHYTFLSSLRSRLTKLQVVRHFWQRNDIKGGINVVGKLPDHYVQSDVVSVLMEKMDILTLDLFSCLLPMVMGLLNSRIDRHMNVSLEMLLKLVAIFGPVIQSTMSASPSVGVDLQAERRRDCCKQCFIQLQKIKQVLPSVVRRGGLLARSAQELNLVLRDL